MAAKYSLEPCNEARNHKDRYVALPVHPLLPKSLLATLIGTAWVAGGSIREAGELLGTACNACKESRHAHSPSMFGI